MHANMSRETNIESKSPSRDSPAFAFGREMISLPFQKLFRSSFGGRGFLAQRGANLWACDNYLYNNNYLKAKERFAYMLNSGHAYLRAKKTIGSNVY